MCVKKMRIEKLEGAEKHRGVISVGVDFDELFFAVFEMLLLMRPTKLLTFFLFFCFFQVFFYGISGKNGLPRGFVRVVRWHDRRVLSGKHILGVFFPCAMRGLLLEGVGPFFF
jgi:hypothetical protein